MYDAAALGELLIDFTEEGKNDTGYPILAAHPGGAPANFLAALARNGGKTAMIGMAGADGFGRQLKQSLEELQIDTEGLVLSEDYFTTLAFVTLDAAGERDFSFARKPGADTRLSWEQVDRRILENTHFFHFGSLSMTDEPARTATVRSLEYAARHGAVITYDPNLRRPLWKDLREARTQILQGMAYADIVKLSDEEAAFLWGLEPEEAVRFILREYDTKLVYLTCGEKGCCYGSRSGIFGSAKGLKGLTVIDTTGAGDIFFGSAVAGILKLLKRKGIFHSDPTADRRERSAAGILRLTQEELDRTAAYACAAAGLSTERHGGITSVPSPEEVASKVTF